MALRCVVMIEKCRAPSIIRKAMRRQLWSTTARLTLQPSSFAFATPAASILRLASSVSRWVGMKSGIAGHSPPSTHQIVRARREQLLHRDRLGDDALGQRVPPEFSVTLPVGPAPLG